MITAVCYTNIFFEHEYNFSTRIAYAAHGARIILNTNRTNCTNIFSTRISQITRIYNSPLAIARSADSCYYFPLVSGPSANLVLFVFKKNYSSCSKNNILRVQNSKLLYRALPRGTVLKLHLLLRSLALVRNAVERGHDIGIFCLAVVVGQLVEGL